MQLTQFRLAFGLEVVMPIEFQVLSLRVQVQERLKKKKSEQLRLERLMELEEDRLRNM